MTDIDKRLTQVYNESPRTVRRIDELRMVLFSDLHKGQRDGADDFQQCEATYLAALNYYWQSDYEIALIGDIEDLWECWPKPVIAAYSNVLEEEKRFATAQDHLRYWRIMGNHDDLWYEPDKVAEHLGPFLGDVQVAESIRLAVTDANAVELGEFFLVHGHQGTPLMERYRDLSQSFVRYIFRPLQRLFRFKWTAPSNNFKLKKEHEQAMYSWADSANGPVLIAGHTHHPVWVGLSYEQALEELERFEQRTRDIAEQKWIQQEIGGRVELPGKKPCYFNTGCCSFSDGSITGLELEGGEIRLIRWRSSNQPDSTPAREILFAASLADVFSAVGSSQ